MALACNCICAWSIKQHGGRANICGGRSSSATATELILTVQVCVGRDIYRICARLTLNNIIAAAKLYISPGSAVIFIVPLKLKVKLSLHQTVEAHRAVRRRGSHIFYKIGSPVTVKLSALRSGRPLVPRRFLVVISVRGWVDALAIAAGRNRLIEKWNDLSGKRTRDVSACSIVLQLRHRVPPTTEAKDKQGSIPTYSEPCHMDKY
jgi:hypothetical protein